MAAGLALIGVASLAAPHMAAYSAKTRDLVAHRAIHVLTAA